MIMKNGIVYRGQGAPDRDNTLALFPTDLKRVVVRDSKIERIEANNAFRTGEKFQLVQPMSVHGGIMPEEVVSVQATPWDGSGRRSFNYVGARLEQDHPNGTGDHRDWPPHTRFRGVDGFWVGQIETNQVPRESVMSSWPACAEKRRRARTRGPISHGCRLASRGKKELDRLAKDFPGSQLERASRQCASVHHSNRGSGNVASEIDASQAGTAVRWRGEIAQNHLPTRRSPPSSWSR